MLFKLWIMVLLSLPVTNENLFILRAMKLSTEDMTYFSFICSKSLCSQVVIKVDILCILNKVLLCSKRYNLLF